jgi:ABC-type dipeptide/oligopeptide/nickel transport system ATPase subunit
MSENTPQRPLLGHDEPIQSTREDRFDRGVFVHNLAEALKRSSNEHGLVVGIGGPWGSGKTSLKNMLVETLREPHPDEKDSYVHVVEFEPWMYSGSGRMVALMFSAISKALSPKGSSVKHVAAKAFKGLGSAVSTALVAGDAVLPGSSAAAGSVAKAFHGVAKALEPNSQDIDELSKRREKLVKQLNRSQTRIIVFIDDLDRLMDDEVVDMLRTVKAVGDLPYMTYVLLYDQDSITKSLDNSCHNKGVEYLEKIIQVPIGLPTPPEKAVENLLKEQLADIAGKQSKQIYSNIDRLFGPITDPYDSCVLPFLNNPRDAIRLSNEFRLRYSVLEDDVEIGDLLGITSLEVFRPELHRWIMSRKQLLCSPVANSFSSQYFDKEEENRSKTLAEQLKSISSEADLAALESLFPFAQVARAGNLSGAYIDPDSGDRNICRRKDFDAYFRLSIDRDLLHESEFKQFLLIDSLNDDDLDEAHFRIFTNRSFPSNAGKYLGTRDIERAAKVIGFCLDLETQLGAVFDECRTLDVAIAIMNSGADSPEHLKLVNAAIKTITDSESSASAPAATCLALIIQEALHPMRDPDLRYVNLMQSMPNRFSLNIPIHREDREQWERNMDQLRHKLKTLKEPKLTKPFGDRILRLCAGAIPYLYDNDDEAYEAYKALSHLTSANRFALYTAEALTTPQDDRYVMNLPLLQRLVTPESYQSAIDAWINNQKFRNNTSCDWNAVAAYETTFDSTIPSTSVASKQTKTTVAGWTAAIKDADNE